MIKRIEVEFAISVNLSIQDENVDPTAPLYGVPMFNSEVFFIETACMEE